MREGRKYVRKGESEMSQTKNILKRMIYLSLLTSVGFAALLSLAQTTSIGPDSTTTGRAAAILGLG